ncbi:hypothetical protein CY34DRAFT_805840 [Suillus luteus UH-Slu-Lm8-n1]|uniref:Uncharacterized protein n=1 Tax=Suillus luteus UH-Slu-Lm8-n1 TaxID=930992 RepID=A0A0D0B535_9AGAM|nr:hypothetical protein CY34DRAFT_805840 [Suillus luteus UH-Slu-Lm8-n1]
MNTRRTVKLRYEVAGRGEILAITGSLVASSLNIPGVCKIIDSRNVHEQAMRLYYER